MKRVEPHWITEEEEKHLGSEKWEPRYNGDPVVRFGSLWYFFDETWTELFGPFENIEDADESVKKYTMEYL